MRKNQARDSVAAERRHKSFELRKSGLSYHAIGRELGISHTQARRNVVEILEQHRTQTNELATELRELEVARLDDTLAALWASKHEPQVASTIIRIGERRAKLLGLDAPTQLEHMLDPGAVQTVLGFALSGALRLLADIRQAVVDAKPADELLAFIDEGQGVYVAEFEQRSAAELSSGSEAA